MIHKREFLRTRRHKRSRLKMQGSSTRPRLVIRRSINHFHAQAVDDAENKTLFSLSTLDKEIKGKFPSAGNIKAAEFLGEVFAKRAKEKGFTKFVFDRSGYLYQGRIKAFADALRKGGLEF